ncbi:hypothetical protein TraAM80_02194 [Trypanosoma rangeli]|uniref:Uncharacterized protein n=1 Tax=Trypanosoma rangeli TaxID=5698 RepID=A0A3R7NXS3_TRYRA|nr:uncharacterized protein TraAM80_02194 [Trypanosoma rangeli]RNF09397.1 hypothetical protein TraAM80_02194 [Trypanosoma rangeli]|eukprot:RNF09397.1 hypothetical protein TraAM80_02194 [Trypanosoma rangeli]
MPYDFVRPKRPSPSEDIVGAKEKESENEDAEGRIQRELEAWRLHMRQERQRRLLAAAARAERTRNAEASPPSHLAPQDLKGDGSHHSDAPPRQDLTALQQYRRELREVVAGAQQGRGNSWTGSACLRRQRRLRTNGVTYHEARSVLREYIHRPPPPSPNVRKTPAGALRAYKDALALSVRACSEAPLTTPARWHQRPLRSISTHNRRQEVPRPNLVATTRSMTLRRRHTESFFTDHANASTPRFGRYRGVQPSKEIKALKPSRRPVLEPTRAYRNAMGQQAEEYNQNAPCREQSFYTEKEVSPRSSVTSRHPSPRRSTTRPMVAYPIDSPQPCQPSHAPYIRQEEEPDDVFHASTRASPDAEVDVFSQTPVLRGGGMTLHYEEQPRREPSPLLRELLGKLSLSSPSLYRPDLYQGRT